jgi:hypothetical protein
MLKILDATKIEELPTTKVQRLERLAAGKSEELLLDHLRFKSARIELDPKPIVEVILAYCDDEGNESGTTEQFILSGDDAERFIDRKEFVAIINHLENIAAVSSTDKEYEDLRNFNKGCKIPCQVIKQESVETLEARKNTKSKS